MEKTREQILMEKLRKVGHRARMGMAPGGHGHPPMPPHGPGKPGHMGPPHGMPPHGGPRPMPPHGGFPRERLLLRVLEAGDAGLRQKDLGEAIGINPSSLSEQIDRLEADRYLERRANPDDKRSTLIFLTEKGKARAYEVQDERQQAAREFCAGLTEEEQETLIQLLDKLLAD